MKILVSYLSSLYDTKKTITLINETTADAIHADLMDGTYVGEQNFKISDLDNFFENNQKPLEFHLMVDKPSRYLNYLYKYEPTVIYIHPETDDVLSVISEIKSHNVKSAIAINPDEEISKYSHLYPLVDKVLLMSVYPGKGGQTFLSDTPKRLIELLEYKNVSNFDIVIDGGINNLTIKEVIMADGVVVGSYICQNPNFQDQINTLK